MLARDRMTTDEVKEREEGSRIRIAASTTPTQARVVVGDTTALRELKLTDDGGRC